MNEDYKFWLDLGICPKCHKRKIAPGRHACSECLAKSRKREAESRKRKLEQNKDNPELIEREMEKRRNAVREYRERHKAQGLCIHCSNKAVPGLQICEKHRQQQIAYWNNIRKHKCRHTAPRQHLDPPTASKRTKADLGKMFALYNAGWKNRDIARELKTSESTVYKWLERARKEKETRDADVS